MEFEGRWSGNKGGRSAVKLGVSFGAYVSSGPLRSSGDQFAVSAIIDTTISFQGWRIERLVGLFVHNQVQNPVSGETLPFS